MKGILNANRGKHLNFYMKYFNALEVGLINRDIVTLKTNSLFTEFFAFYFEPTFIRESHIILKEICTMTCVEEYSNLYFNKAILQSKE